jgi:hypothetical protein
VSLRSSGHPVILNPTTDNRAPRSAATGQPRNPPPGCVARRACDPRRVRHSEFWTLVDDEFGRAYGRTLVRDHVVGALGHRTAEQALAAGEDPRAVWFALCDELEVPPARRWGRDESADRARRRRA